MTEETKRPGDNCPNCGKLLYMLDNHIFKCEDCGCFRVDHDGAWVPCDMPESEPMPTVEPQEIEEPSDDCFLRISLI
jgi:ribosomal protein L37AE/L43A